MTAGNGVPLPRACRACGARIRLTWLTIAPGSPLCTACALRDEDWPAALHAQA